MAKAKKKAKKVTAKKAPKAPKLMKMTKKEKEALLKLAEQKSEKPKKAKAMEPKVVLVETPPKKRKRRTKAEIEATKVEPVKVEPVVETKTKRKRRTKAEIAEAKANEKPKRKKRTKEEVAQAKVEKKVNGDPVFTAKKRDKLPVAELRMYLRERYTPNAGLRIADYILQLCDECEHLEIELAKEKMITKTMTETLKS